MTRPLILLTNDDGIRAPGLKAMAQALRPLGDLLVVAPVDERSAVSHALTIHHPIRIESAGRGRYAVSGTPVDCVLFGLKKIAARVPQLIVSGINAGANLGDDTLYSGTVAAAREGSMYRIPSIAVSLALSAARPDYGRAASFTARLAEGLLRSGMPPGVFLNLNFPLGLPLGVRITRQGAKVVQSLIAEKDDPRGKKYYWIGEDQNECGGEPDTDYFAVKNGYISITPLQRDQTAHAALSELHHLPDLLQAIPKGEATARAREVPKRRSTGRG